MKNYHSLLFILIQLISSHLFAQALPVGFPVMEEYVRINQLIEADSQSSFMVRPIYLKRSKSLDSISSSQDHWGDQNRFSTFVKCCSNLTLLPLIVKTQFNTHQPYGWNDGVMIPAKGFQKYVSFGAYFKTGSLSVQFQPEVVYAQNLNFPSFPSTHNDSLWKFYFDDILNDIDNPEKYGDRHFFKAFLGQSSIRFNFKKLSIGASSESLWWGPGVRNSLLMSNNAPGFPHISLKTTEPISSYIGSFEGQVLSGFLKGSRILPSDTFRTFNGEILYEPKGNGKRYINGMVIVYQPKWVKGLFLGFSRVFYINSSDLKSGLNSYLPIFGSFFKGKTRNEDSLKRDQMVSGFFRLLVPAGNIELYAELGRNDHSQNFRDFMLEPEHSIAYIIGTKKLFKTKKSQSYTELMLELSNLQVPSTIRVRDQNSWYAHHLVRHGYTNLGQIIGAGIGPGGNSQTIAFNFYRHRTKTGIGVERRVHNNDFYYRAFASSQEYGRHWVDLAFSVNKSWLQKRFIYSANLSLVRSLNYQWQYNTALDENVDVTNVHATFSISYLFR